MHTSHGLLAATDNKGMIAYGERAAAQSRNKKRETATHRAQLSRRTLLAVTTAALPLARARAQTPTLKISVLTGMSGPFKDLAGPLTVFDRDGVDVITEVGNSGVGLAVAGVAKEKNKVYLPCGAGTADLTGRGRGNRVLVKMWDSELDLAPLMNGVIGAGSRRRSAC